jgi:hypothetical protein
MRANTSVLSNLGDEKDDAYFYKKTNKGNERTSIDFCDEWCAISSPSHCITRDTGVDDISFVPRRLILKTMRTTTEEVQEECRQFFTCRISLMIDRFYGHPLHKRKGFRLLVFVSNTVHDSLSVQSYSTFEGGSAVHLKEEVLYSTFSSAKTDPTRPCQNKTFTY